MSKRGVKSSDVERFMRNLEHPHKEELQRLREVILSVDPRIGETIKWSCPTFTFDGNIASLVVRTRKCAQVMFHQGGSLQSGKDWLEGTGKDVRFANFDSLIEVNKHAAPLKRVIREWFASRTAKAK
jgi:hypothetical protein